MRKWLHVPLSGAERLAMACGLLALLALAALQSSAGPKLLYPDQKSGSTVLAFLLGVLVVYDGSLLWVTLRPYYASFASARRIFFGTYAVLAVIHCGAWAAILAAQGHARPAFGSGAPMDPRLTLWCIAIGMTALALSLAASAFWKSDVPGFASVWQVRQNAIEWVEGICATPIRISASDFDLLISALPTLKKDADTVRARVGPADRALLAAWSSAAGTLAGKYDTRSYDELAALGCDDEVRNALAELKRDR